MASLPIEVLLGLYLGLLTGIIPAVVAWTLGFVFRYFTGVSVPALAVVVLGVAIAGVNGGLLALIDPTILTLPNAERVVVAIIIVMMMSLYAHSEGDALGATFPHRLTFRTLRRRSLSSDVVEFVGGRGQVKITVAGEVADIEGYPPLPSAVRTAIHDGEWSFSVDIPLTELEDRLEDRLRTAHDLAEVQVSLDERGRATIAAAPGTRGVSSRVPAGRRAVSIEGLVPTGLARGEDITLVLDEDTVDGTLVSARSSIGSTPVPATVTAPTGVDGIEEDAATMLEPPRAATTDGGDGRVTVAVARIEAERVLEAERAHIVVGSRGTRGEFELLAVLRRAGARMSRLTVGPTAELAGLTLGEAEVRETFEVAVLAVRDGDGWNIAPSGETRLASGDKLFVVGRREGLERFRRVVS